MIGYDYTKNEARNFIKHFVNTNPTISRWQAVKINDYRKNIEF